MVTLLLSEASTSEEEHFKLMLVQTEVERVKFLIRAYLRTRLSKVSLLSLPLLSLRVELTSSPSFPSQIERFAQHISSTPAMHYLLSPLELSHAKRFVHSLCISLVSRSMRLTSPPSTLHPLKGITPSSSHTTNPQSSTLFLRRFTHSRSCTTMELIWVSFPFLFPSLVRTDSRRVFRSFSLTLSLPPSPFRP